MNTGIAIVLGVLLAAAGARGQGTVNFSTKVTGSVDAKVFAVTADGFAPADGRVFGQLYAGPPGGILAAVGMPVPFRSDVGAGYITAGGKVVVPGIPGGSSATIELRVWMASLGATFEAAEAASGGVMVGRSAPITVSLGGGGLPFSPDPNLVGLQGFVFPIIPEPSGAALGWLGLAVLGGSRSAPRKREWGAGAGEPRGGNRVRSSSGPGLDRRRRGISRGSGASAWI